MRAAALSGPDIQPTPPKRPFFTMVTKSALKMALAAEKGVDFKKLTFKRKQKAAARQERKANGGAPVDDSSADENEDEVEDVEGGNAEDDQDDEEEELQVRICRQLAE